MILLVGASVNIAVGQASNYSWATLTGQSLYTISSPTSVTTVANGSVDDGNNIITLPFTFTYNNIAYTQMTVSTNGYIVAGSVPGATQTTASLTTGTSGNPAFSILGRDANLNTANGGNLTHGAATGDLYVFEYVNISGASGGFTSATIYATMQVVLYGPASSSPGKIEFIYGTSTGILATSGQVGIRDAAGQYINGLTGVANSAPATSATWPVSGTLYSFTPPGPCLPATAQPTVLTLTPSGLSVLNGSFTAASPVPTGYLVVRTTTNTAPVPVDATVYTVGNSAIGYIESAGPATTFTSTGLLLSTTYYYWVFSYSNTVCSGGPLYLAGPLTNNATTGACAITGTKSVGGSGADYLNLTDAIADLVTNGISGPVILELNSTYPGAGETYPITLGAVPCMSSTNTVTIRIAAGAGARIITSNNTTATVYINGGNYWIIDGRQGGAGTTRDLSIFNTSSATGGSAITFTNEASNNIIQYTNLQSAFSSTTSGVIVFSTTTGTNGNDNNTISNNSIDGGAGSTASPTLGVARFGIYSLGSTGTADQNNSGNIISDNLIFNNFVTGAAITSTGIYVAAGNTDWTISGNSIYQTNTRTATVGVATVYGIYINNSSSGNNFTVSNNYIGGSSVNAGGAAWTVGGAFANRMTALGMNVGTTTASSVQGNTITNFVFSTTSGAATVTTGTSLAGTWGGIVVGAGNVNVGTVTGNTVGSASATGTITVTSSTNSGAVIGIGSGGTGIVNISNNNVGGITSIGSSVSVTHNIIGILSIGTGVAVTTVNANTIGSASTPNSLNASTVITSSTSQYINGISNTGTGTVNITNNLVANLNNNATNSVAASTGSSLRGISVTSGIGTVTGNTIRNMAVASQGTSTTVHSVIGIYYSATTAGSHTVSQNTIHSISNNYVSASAAVYVSGIYYSGPSAGTNVISRNLVYGISATSTSATAANLGIVIAGGVSTYSNNMVRLGYDASGTAITNGILMMGMSKTTTANNNVYHNTIYVGGTGVAASAAHTYAFIRTGTGTDDVKNNIFINERSNAIAGTGKHYSIGLSAITTLTSDNNLYNGAGTGYTFGYVGTPGTTDYANLAAWQAANPTLDINSVFADPCLVNATAATPDLHLTNCALAGSPADGGGVLVAAITDDFDGQTRSTLSPVDIGADAGNYGPAGVDVGISALVNPTAISCHSATENVTVTLKNYSTSDHDFALNPVTITVNVTNAITAGPLTVVINTGTLLAGATQNEIVGQVNTTANGTYTFTSSASATGDVTPANDGDVTNVTINYTALSLAVTADAPELCFIGSTKLFATPTGGTAPYTYLWDAGTDTDSTVNNTGSITTTTTYNVTVTDACGLTANGTITITVNTPTVLTTAPGSRCGNGSVTLGATASGISTLNWYAANTGGTLLGTGTSFNTPVINIPTTFYVAASTGGSTSNVSKLAPETASTGTVLSTYGQDFTVTTGFTLNNVQVFSTTGTSITISLYSSGGTTQLQTTGATAVTAGTSPTINLGWYIAPGTYRLCANAMTGNFIRDNTNTTYPFALGSVGTMNGFVSSITGTVSTSSSYYFMYNWSISTGCESARTAVLANVTTPPSIDAVATATSICVGQSTVLSVTSSNDPDYTYSWSPAGPGTVSPTTTTSYIVNAVDNTAGPNAGCATADTVVVTVNVNPIGVTATASSTTLCAGGTIDLTATGYDPSSYEEGYTMVNNSGVAFTDISVSGTSVGTISDDSEHNIALPFSFNFNGAPYTDIRIGTNGALIFGTTGDIGYANTCLPATNTGTSGIPGPGILAMWDDLTTSGSVTSSITTQQVGSKFIIQWTNIDNFDASGIGTVTFQVQLDQSNGKIHLVYSDVSYGDVLADAGILATVGLSYSTTAFLQYSCLTASLADNQSITFNPNNSPVPTYSWTSTPGGFTSAVQNPTAVTPASTPITYTVVVSTAAGCTGTATTLSIDASTLAISSVVDINVLCNGQLTGQLTATATGGTAPYNYVISGPTVNTTGATTGVFTGLAAGNYTVTVTDAAPCSVTSSSVTITEPTALTFDSPVTVDPTCYNGSNGTITAVATSGTGTPGYTYTIAGPTVNTTGDANGQYTGLTAGNYTITVTDANSCTATSTTITLNNPAALPITASNNGPVCSGTDATLTIAETYVTYSWTGPGTINTANSQTATAVAPANGDVFTITVTDGLGCSNSATTTVTVTPNDPVSVSISVAPSLEVCTGTTVTFTAAPVNGGGSPTYKWFVNATEQLGETASTFVTTTLNDQDVVTAELTSSITCTTGSPATSNAITITVSGFVFADVTLAASSNPVCDGTQVTLTATPTGGGNAPTYEFFLNTISVQNSSSPTYTYTPANGDDVYVIMTSSLVCAIGSPVTSASVIMTVNPVPAQPTITAGGVTTFCNGGSVVLTSSYVGGNQWYESNVLLPGEINDNITVTTSGSYTVIHTALGCSSIASAPEVVTVNDNPTASITGSLTYCTAGSTLLTAVATAGSGTITGYQWVLDGVTNLGTASTETVSVAGSYTVIVTNSNGCSTTSAAHVVTEAAVPTASISGNTTICGGTTEILTATATAGSGTIDTYQWVLNGVTNVGTNSATYSATAAGSYTVIVTNSNGCSTTSAAFVLNSTGPLVGTYTIDNTLAASCTNYVSFASAITDLNLLGVGGNVIFNINQGYTETAPNGGLGINMCALGAGLQPNSAQTVIFQKVGVGPNPVIMAGTGSGSADIIFSLIGADYVTINGIDLTANPANVTAAEMTEIGYALLKCSGTDGAQNNTIENSTITLDKTNTNGSTAIYGASQDATLAAIVTTATSGANSFNIFRNNTATNTNSGILMLGYNDVTPFAFYDQNNEIGQTGAGNIMTNLGGSSLSVYGVATSYQNNLKIVDNNINTGASAGTGGIYGINAGSASNANTDITGNTITTNASLSGTGQNIALINNSGSRFGRPTSASINNTVNILNNTIQNCTYPSSGTSTLWLLYNGVGVAADSLGSANLNITGNQLLNNSFSSNTSGTMFGIISQKINDVGVISNNTISGNSNTGNTGSALRTIVTGLGGHSTGTIPYAQNLTVSGNTISGNTTTATTGAVDGIAVETYTGSSPQAGTSVTISNNNVGNATYTTQTSGVFTGITTSVSTNVALVMTGNTVTNITRSATTGAFNGIRATGTALASSNLSNNTLSNISLTATSTIFSGITHAGSSSSTSSLAMNSNTVNNCVMTGTGTMTLMDAGNAVTTNMNLNTITNNQKTGASGTMYCARTSVAAVTFNGNTITGNSIPSTTGATLSAIYGYYQSSSATAENLTNNNINTLTIGGAGTSTSSIITAIYTNPLTTTTKDVSGNTIHTLSISVPGTVRGIDNVSGATVNIFKNKIYDLSTSSSSATALVEGIRVTSGANVRLYNNFIGNLNATATANADGVRGIMNLAASSSSIGIYFNTIYLNGTSTGTGFGNTGIYHTTSTTATTGALDMRNNIVYNSSTPTGAGRAVAYRRSSTTLTNFTNASNNNLYYVAAGANNHIYSDGTNHLGLVAYKALGGIAPRETNSQEENVAFQSTTGSDAAFLKVSTGAPTLVEGGAQPIAGITDDYFGTIRNGSGPDIGAHEDNFPNIALVITSSSVSPSTIQCTATTHTVTVVLGLGIAPVTSVSLAYSFDGVPQTPIAMTGGPTSYSATIPAATPANAIVTWTVTATDGTYSPTASGSYQDEQLTGLTAVATAAPTVVCSGSPATLTASVNKPGNAQIGTGTSTTTTYPYYRLYGSSKTQMLYLASELTAAGLSAGPITSIGFDVTTASTAMPNVKISMKNTASATVTAFETGTTQVATELLYTPVVGISNHPITPFTWDGTSNLLVEFCFENNDGGGSSTTVRYSNPGFAATFKQYQDFADTHCSAPAGITSSSSTIRPNLYLAGNTAPTGFTYSWSDGVSTVGTGSPLVVNPLVTTNYTVTATDANGCSIVSTTPATVSVIPLAAVNITTSAATCASGFTLTANTTGGGAPYSYSWSDGSATVYPDAQTITATLPAGSYTFTVTVTDGCGGSVNMSLPVTVNGLPTISITPDPANGLVCGDKVTMTAAGASTYEWSPATGLNATTGAVVFATPAGTTTYTVTGTDANGCSNTATQLITKVVSIAMSATATPATVCEGGTVQLNSTATLATPLDAYYTYSASTGVALADTTGSTTIIGTSNDDTPAAGTEFFPFDYEGVNYTHFSVSPDGWVNLRTVVTAATSDFSNDIAAPGNNPTIGALWDDNATGPDGYVKYLVSGTAPNRVLVLHWFVAGSRSLTSNPATASFQVLLYETSNKIEYRYGTISLYNAAPTLSVGLTSVANPGGYMSITTSDNSLSTSTANNANATAPPSGTMYSFTYAVPTSTISLSWSPSANLDYTNIPNPLASNLTASVDYVLTATNTATGCSVKDTVSITVNPLPAATFTGLPATICYAASAVTLTGTPTGGTFSGPGISGNSFTPSSAGVGTHTITYSVTDISSGCSNSTTQQVEVIQPTVTISGLPATICVNAAAITINGNYSGGTFTGTGITDNLDGTASFNPATAGVGGPYSITYSYTDVNGCSNSISQNITVNALPTVSFTGLPATLCVHTAAITLTGNHGGGTFTGTGITDNANGTASFNPATAGVGGPYTITYSYTDVNGCTNSQSQTITITANFGYANLQWPANGSYCDGGSLTAYGQVYKLGLTEAGGAGAGIVAELGWSTSNTDPATWTNWQAASFNTQVGNNDEYSSALSLPAGTYYYTFRYSLDGCGFQYGGYSAGGGNFWDGTNYVSGVLTVNALPTVSFTGLPTSALYQCRCYCYT